MYDGAAVLVPPAAGTFGTMPRNALRGPGMREWDLSVQKNWKFRDRLTAQFRSEFFNVLNSVEYGGPSSESVKPVHVRHVLWSRRRRLARQTARAIPGQSSSG